MITISKRLLDSFALYQPIKFNEITRPLRNTTYVTRLLAVASFTIKKVTERNYRPKNYYYVCIEKKVKIRQI